MFHKFFKLHLHLIFLQFTLGLIVTSCSISQSSKNLENNLIIVKSINQNVQNEPKDYKSQIIEIDAKIYAWWWSESEVRNEIVGNNSLPKSHYVELEKWQYDGEGITTYPQKVDFVTIVKNSSSAHFRGTIEFQISSKFDNYENLYYRDIDDTIKFNHKNFNKLPWINEITIYKQPLEIETSKEANISLKNFDLENLLNTQENGRPVSGLRFKTNLFDSTGVKIMEKEKIIPVLLGD